MRRHKAEAPLLQMGCWALQNLMRDSEINHVAVVAAGGIQLVLGAMDRFPSDVAIAQHGCGALGGMAYDLNSQVRGAETRREWVGSEEKAGPLLHMRCSFREACVSSVLKTGSLRGATPDVLCVSRAAGERGGCERRGGCRLRHAGPPRGGGAAGPGLLRDRTGARAPPTLCSNTRDLSRRVCSMYAKARSLC